MLESEAAIQKIQFHTNVVFNDQRSLHFFLMSSYHKLRDLIDLLISFDFELTEEQKIMIEEDLNDYHIIQARSFVEQCYILCCLLRKPESYKPIISYDTIGRLFSEEKTHGSIIDE